MEEEERRQIRVLELLKNDIRDTISYNLRKGEILRFAIGSTLFGERVNVFTNYPLEGEQFKRNKFSLLPWNASEYKGDESSVFADIDLALAGTFEYKVEDGITQDMYCHGYFLVEPEILLPTPSIHNRRVLPLDGIQHLTVISKLLGPLREWPERLIVAKECGYNMVHFTPIQKLGGSDSAYSIEEQLGVNPKFECTMDELKGFIDQMYQEWSIVSIVDIVLNHTAATSPWLKEHPDSGYNLVNSPHLKPAYVIDWSIQNMSREIGEGKWEQRGLWPVLNTEEQVNNLHTRLLSEVFPALKIEEFFCVHIDREVERFRLFLEKGEGPAKQQQRERRHSTGGGADRNVAIIQDKHYRRFGCYVDMHAAWHQFVGPSGQQQNASGGAGKFDAALRNFRSCLEYLNGEKVAVVWDDLRCAASSIIGTVRYERLASHGPRMSRVSVPDKPIHTNYFVNYGEEIKNLHDLNAAVENPARGALVMATNGWIMDFDVTQNFADPKFKHYLRRDIVAWGDCVKLRFGAGRKDSPFLWQHMEEYMRLSATIFRGIRLDNCHNTPLHVAEHMLDVARQVRPDFVVVAELFTGSIRVDSIFVNRLGITALLREALRAHNAHQQGELVYMYGGDPVGAFEHLIYRPIRPTIPYPLFMDMTHDNNPTAMQERSIYDLLPSSALVSMAACATGSVWGYDQFVPHHIHVVSEKRLYPKYTDSSKLADQPGYMSLNDGIMTAKLALNMLHSDMAVEGYKNIFVDDRSGDTIAVTRHHPGTHNSIIMVTRSAFSHPSDQALNSPPSLPSMRIEGVVEEIIVEARVYKRYDEAFEPSRQFINGVKGFECEVREHISAKESKFVDVVDVKSDDSAGGEGGGNVCGQVINFKFLPPGSCIALKVVMTGTARLAVQKLKALLTRNSSERRHLREIASSLSMPEFNRVFFRCAPEELSDGLGVDAYALPQYRKLHYCGLEGFMPLLDHIRRNNDLGHPLCRNLRAGNWLLDYISSRLKLSEGTRDLGHWFEDVFQHLKTLPRFLVPTYFDQVTFLAHEMLQEAYFRNCMSDFVVEGSLFVKTLSLGTAQFCGLVRNSKLPRLSPNIHPPLPGKTLDPLYAAEWNEKNKSNGKSSLSADEAAMQNNDGADSTSRYWLPKTPSLSAGLPHFSSGYMRNWGRDTFIALPGLLIMTGQFDYARYIILAFAGTLRHGLIPNLLNEGTGARYNCRDAVWWWLQSIQTYVRLHPTEEGPALLKDRVQRLWPQDDVPEATFAIEQTLEDVMQEALQRHVDGLEFRERNAGSQIDAHMTDHGFNVRIGVDRETGFVYGGNEWNCGTWMDKMGSSPEAGNKGRPATPRDGSAVELVGLSYSCVKWLAAASASGKYKFGGVNVSAAGDGGQKKGADEQQGKRWKGDDNAAKSGGQQQWTWQQWADRIKKNFERCFWIAETNEQMDGSCNDFKLIHKRNIYKDTYKATQRWGDYQLRPNFCVTLALAPDLVSPQHAGLALDAVDEHLLGVLGLKTLDPDDWNFAPVYDNDNHGTDYKIAHGFNYHNGPEWVWPMGFYLLSHLVFAELNTVAAVVNSNTNDAAGVGSSFMTEACRYVDRILARHYIHVNRSEWLGLPELTNVNGEFCAGSCPTQAWSMGCMLEVLFKLNRLKSLNDDAENVEETDHMAPPPHRMDKSASGNSLEGNGTATVRRGSQPSLDQLVRGKQKKILNPSSK